MQPLIVKPSTCMNLYQALYYGVSRVGHRVKVLTAGHREVNLEGNLESESVYPIIMVKLITLK